MTGEELQALRSMMREEIGTAVQTSEQRTRTAMREEIGTAIQASEQRTRTAMREEISTAIQASEQRTRTAMREEISTAVQASESRTGERLDKIDGRLDRIETHVDHIDSRLVEVETAQRELHSETLYFHSVMNNELAQTRANLSRNLTQIKHEQSEIISVLNEATKTINSMQADQRALESKVDDNLQAFKRDLQAFKESTFDYMKTFQERVHGDVQFLMDGLNRFARQFIEANRMINERLTYHENAPLNETHPRARQPGDAA